MAAEFTHQLETGDEAFLEHLHLPGRAAEALAEARQRGGGAAAEMVAEYYRGRRAPRWSFYMHGTPWHETDAPGSVVRKAERLLQNGFINSWPPHQEFDLNVPGSRDPDWLKGLEEARTSVARGTFLTELSTAFALTGNPAYALRAMELIRSYVQHLPFVLDPRFEEDQDLNFGGRSNQSLHVAYRIFRLTDFLFSGAFHARKDSGERLLPDADLFWVVKQLWFYMRQFYRLLDGPMRRDNHHLVDHGHTPFVMGVVFPEFSISSELVKAGMKVIRFHFGNNLLKDGSYAEHSAEYQYHILYHFLHPLGLAQANGIRLLTEKQVEALRRWVQFSVRAVKPDGWLPAIGDSGGRPLAHLFGSLAGPVMTAELASAARSLGIVPGRHITLSMADVARKMKNVKAGKPSKVGLSAYYLNQGTKVQGVCHEPATCQYPAGGYTFFRSAWNDRADYLAVSHFPPNIPGTHSHWDPLSFLLHTNGQTLIGEPASNLYEDRRFHGHGGESPTPPPHPPGGERPKLLYRGYNYNVSSHNCLVMNDDLLKPIEAMCHGTFWGGYPPECGTGVFAAGGPIEVAEVWHDGNAPTRHRRFVIHLQGIGFAFVDILSSKKMRMAPMQYSQYFHFEGDVEISPELPQTQQAMRAFKDEASCLIVPGKELEARWKTFRDPYLHDTYMVPATKGLPWVGELTRRVRGPAVFSTFLLTHCTQGSVTLGYLGQKTAGFFAWQTEAISAHRLDLGAQGTVLLASCPFGTKVQHDTLSTDAELAVVRLNASGKVSAWGVARGSNLAVGGRTLLSGRKREWTEK